VAFRCFLDVPKNVLAPDEPLDPSVDLDSYETLVMYACELLSRTDARFHLGGFGSEDWNLDIRYDFSIFMEQFPELMHALASRSEFQLDLYSQGIERVLIFHPHDDSVQIRCISGTSSWTPFPDIEIIRSSDLRRMLSDVGTDFAEALRSIDERIGGMEPFNRWLQGNFH
jgi:hypothetical protein